MYFLSPCIQVHNLCSTVFPTHALCKTGEIRTTAKEVLLSCSPDVLRVRVATSQLGRNSLLCIGTFTCLWIEECQTDIHNNVLLNFPLLKLWEPVSIHSIYNVPLGAGASSRGPEGRSCEFYSILFISPTWWGNKHNRITQNTVFVVVVSPS